MRCPRTLGEGCDAEEFHLLAWRVIWLTGWKVLMPRWARAEDRGIMTNWTDIRDARVAVESSKDTKELASRRASWNKRRANQKSERVPTQRIPPTPLDSHKPTGRLSALTHARMDLPRLPTPAAAMGGTLGDGVSANEHMAGKVPTYDCNLSRIIASRCL